jgi:hypothetical protein
MPKDEFDKKRFRYNAPDKRLFKQLQRTLTPLQD